MLDFGTRTKHSLSGIIASAPLILQTKAAPKIARYVGGKVSAIAPYTNIPATVNATVSIPFTCKLCPVLATYNSPFSRRTFRETRKSARSI